MSVSVFFGKSSKLLKIRLDRQLVSFTDAHTVVDRSWLDCQAKKHFKTAQNTHLGCITSFSGGLCSDQFSRSCAKCHCCVRCRAFVRPNGLSQPVPMTAEETVDRTATSTGRFYTEPFTWFVPPHWRRVSFLYTFKAPWRVRGIHGDEEPVYLESLTGFILKVVFVSIFLLEAR